MKKLELILKQLLLRMLLIFGESESSRMLLDDLSHRHLKILLIRLNKIGDALISTPLIELLKDNLDCKIEVLADNKNHFIFEHTPSVDKTIIFKKGLNEMFAIRKYISENDFDVIVDLHDDVSTTVSYLVALAPVPFKFGLEKNNKVIFSNTVKRLETGKRHIIERILQLAKLFIIEPNINNCNIFYVPEKTSIEFADEFLSVKFKKRQFLIGINISAGSPARFWGIERFQKLLQYLSDKNVNVVLIAPPNDLELAEKISANNYPIFSQKIFDKAAAIVSKLDLLFTPDTSLVHIASAFEVPVFGLYVKYNTDDMIWYPYKSKYEAVITTEPNFGNMNYGKVIKKFIPFLAEVFNDYKEHQQ